MMMADNLFPRAVQVNNEGAYLLEHREAGTTNANAIILFSEGLYICRDIVEKSDESDDLPRPKFALDAIMCAGIQDRATPPETSTLSSEPDLYRRPITIPTSGQFMLQDASMLSAILMFNQALAHHLFHHSSINEAADQTMLTKAIRLYEFAYSQVVASDCWPHSSCILFACLNNMGVAYHQLGQTKLAHETFEQLSSTLMFFVDLQHRQQDHATTTNNGNMLDQRQNMFFRNAFEYPYSNAYKSRSRRFFPAAAA